MNVFGPVYEAAHGGQSGPSFDPIVGFAVLAMTWFGVGKNGSIRHDIEERTE